MRMWRNCPLVHRWWGRGRVRRPRKSSAAILRKVKIELSQDLEIPLLGIAPKDLKAGSQTYLFTTAKRWKPPTYVSIHGGMDGQNVVDAVEYYTALKRKDMPTHATYGVDKPRRHHAK